LKTLQLFTGLGLTFLATLAFGASIDLSMDSLVQTVIYLIIIGFVFGILIFLINKAPFIPVEWKSFIIYFVYFVAALILINLLLGLAGHPIVSLR